MFRKFFQALQFRMIAGQLRHPRGGKGDKLGRMMNRANEFLYDYTIGIMQPASNESILEIGFGNGKFFDKLFATSADLKLTGLDFSKTMVRAATSNNKKAITEGRLDLRFGRSDKLPFPGNSFDKIFCINVIYFWDQPLQHLQEIQRVLKPGGRFYAAVRSKESMLEMPFTKYGFNFYDRGKWKAVLAEAGLTFIGERAVDEPLADLATIGAGNTQLVVRSLCVEAEKN
ncbi:MAG: class I SAM-dependent methyltransferase [Bacteroidota bacterium]